MRLDCRNCGGSGGGPDVALLCQTCGGSGEVEDLLYDPCSVCGEPVETGGCYDPLCERCSCEACGEPIYTQDLDITMCPPCRQAEGVAESGCSDDDETVG